MIAVVADDFTGAAELAGICLRYGLKVHLCTGNELLHADADVLIVSSDSRSMQHDDAMQVTRELWQKIKAMQPAWVYKKTDSVLRGYVYDELKVQMEVMQQSLAFLLPANPSLGRIIQQQQYYVQGELISSTAFANDPEFPITNASITAMLRAKDVQVLAPGAALPDSGVVVGEAAADDEVHAWALRMQPGIALAGAGDFFTALLDAKFKLKTTAPITLHPRVLYVCGTAYAPSVAYVQQVHKQCTDVFFIPASIVARPHEISYDWLRQVHLHLKHTQKAIIGFNAADLPQQATALDLRLAMASAVSAILKQWPQGELFIEGGSTAAAIFNAMQWQQFHPVSEWERGAVRMQAGNWYVSVKPGSYALPTEIQQVFAP
ncbi:MAG TPA: four-carbon acid sugar kinase family protein [Phnomibacter sp.]|nr:four-carbon acid sugar kinase family protein [Phnomibacter sp.]